ncbi:aminotransferase class V-fold PLP-dependent enzyme [Sphingobacterium suaedae]|uniref:Aminotransferase class V-fold PLP-dependent enzyme n=1 Tax=Sphingobacterium suaedae TaxID=1686402 RepID=A0ABW5KHS5_9SPHI
MPFKHLFDIPSSITYLNTPGNGILPKSNRRWREERERRFFDLHGDLRDQQPAFIQSVREDIGKIFKACTTRVFCTPNFSFGYNVLLDRLPSSYKYLLLDEDYPSLNYPIVNRNLNYKTVKIDEHLEQNILKAIREYQPDVLLLSIVQYITGIKIDLAFIRQLKQDNPKLIIIADGTQFLGTEPFHFDQSGFDAVGTSGYKWLMAGFGNGFMLLSEHLTNLMNEELHDRPSPKEAMWASKSMLQTFFEPGHQDTLSHGTLQQSILFLQETGLENVQKHIHSISAFAHEELAKRNLLLPAVVGRSVRSSLINIQIAPKHYTDLTANDIKCFPRGTGIRIGLHLYNTHWDIEKLLGILDTYNIQGNYEI